MCDKWRKSREILYFPIYIYVFFLCSDRPITDKNICYTVEANIQPKLEYPIISFYRIDWTNFQSWVRVRRDKTKQKKDWIESNSISFIRLCSGLLCVSACSICIVWFIVVRTFRKFSETFALNFLSARKCCITREKNQKSRKITASRQARKREKKKSSRQQRRNENLHGCCVYVLCARNEI